MRANLATGMFARMWTSTTARGGNAVDARCRNGSREKLIDRPPSSRWLNDEWHAGASWQRSRIVLETQLYRDPVPCTGGRSARSAQNLVDVRGILIDFACECFHRLALGRHART